MHDYQRRNYAMLLEVAEFTRFTKPTIAAPKTSCEVIIALAFERRDAVDLMMTHCFRVVAPNVLSQRTMDSCICAFIDIDGHHWGPFGWTQIM